MSEPLTVPPGLKWHREDPHGGFELVFIDDERDPDYDGLPYYYAQGDTEQECARNAWTRFECEHRLGSEGAV